MAGLVGDLLIRIMGDNKEFDQAVQESGKKAESFQNRFKKLGDNMAKAGKRLTTFVTLPIVGIGTAAVAAASHAEEAGDKFDAVFRDQAKRVREWADEYSDSVNRSRFDTEEFAASVQDLFVPLGAARDEAADLSMAVVELATDVSSFNDIPTADVLRDIQSALVGNHETVRKYGVVISEATLKQHGITTESTALEKALARLKLITEGTADAQGNARDTADSFANTFVGLKSDIKDLSIELGRVLLPIVKDIIETVRDLIDRFNDLNPEIKEQIVRWALVAASIGPLLIMLPKLVGMIAALKTIMLAATGPIGIVATAIAAIVTGITLLVQKSRDARNAQELFNLVAEDGANNLEDYNEALDYGIDRRSVLREKLKAVTDALEQHNEEKIKEIRLEGEDAEAYRERLANDPEKLALEQEIEALQDKINAIVYAKDAFVKAKEDEEKAQQEALDEMTAAQIAAAEEQRKIWEDNLNKQLEDIEAAEAEKRKQSEETTEKRFEYEGGYYQWSNDRIDEWTQKQIDANRIIVEDTEDTVEDIKSEWEKYWDEHGEKIKSSTMDFINFSQGAFDQYFKNITMGLDAQSDEYKQIMRDQARVNKVFAIFNTIIDTAQAITKALASLPPPFNWAAAIAVGAAGAAQTAAIIAQPLPAAAKGGRFDSPYIGGEAGPEFAIPDQAPYINALASRIEGAMGNVGIENMMHVTVNLGGQVLYDDIRKASKNGNLLIDAQAIV